MLAFIFSERRVYIDPLDIDCPSEKQNIALVPICLVGPPGIEPGLHDPQPCVLPLYDGPLSGDVCCRAAGNRTRSLP